MRFFSFTWIFLLLVARSSVSIDHGRELQYGGDYGADSSTDYSSSTYGEGDQSSTYDSTAEEDHSSATDDIPQETTPSKINFPSEKSIDKILKTAPKIITAIKKIQKAVNKKQKKLPLKKPFKTNKTVKKSLKTKKPTKKPTKNPTKKPIKLQKKKQPTHLRSQ